MLLRLGFDDKAAEKLARDFMLEGGRRVASALSERPGVVVGTGREDLRDVDDSARENAAEGGRA